VTRRGAILAALLICSSVLLGVEAGWPRPMPCCCSPSLRRWSAGAVYLSWQRGEDPAHPHDVAGDLLDGAGWRHPAQGPLIVMFVVLTIATLAIFDRRQHGFGGCARSGLMWLLVLVLPWFIAIFWRAGDAFFSNSIAAT